MAKILITGGAGFIGSHICDAFAAEKNTIAVIDDLSSGFKKNLPKKVKLLKADIRSEKAKKFIAAFKPDLIVHAAAQISVRISMHDPVLDTQINIVGLINILDALRDRKSLPHFVFISTGGAIYGEQDYFPADEAHPTKPASIYGQAKRVSEIYLDFWAREKGLKFCALRLGNVYGPRQNPHGEAGVVAIFLKMLLAGKTPRINGTGSQTRDFVFVKDVARAVKLSWDKKATGTFNIGTGVETSVLQVYESLRRGLKSSVKAKHGKSLPGEQMRSCIDASLAKRTLGWEPLQKVDQGLMLTAEWFANN